MKPFHVKGSIIDLVAFLNLVPRRRKRLRTLSTRPLETPYINVLSGALHPEAQRFTIDQVIEESPSARTFRLRADSDKGTARPAYFRAGQYISIKERVNGLPVSRAYSIASAPADSRSGFYEITVTRMEGGYLTRHIWENWKEGVSVTTSGPFGFMYHEPIRDSRRVVGIAGGCGITPFRSMVREMAAGASDISLCILYGCNDGSDILYREEFREYERKMPDRFRVIHVLARGKGSAEPTGSCETGFITAEIIKKHTDPSADSYFLCGPAAMYDFVEKELKTLGVPAKRLRMEAYGEIREPGRFSDYPRDALGKNFTVTVRNGGSAMALEASASESVLTALERAGVAPPSVCRSGECQMCRVFLESGKVWISPKSDGRRAADKRNGYIHSCASFPVSDLTIALPRPLQAERG